MAPKPEEIRKRETLDEGYTAVRNMARELVRNGATLADILFHANHIWHEFKVAAFCQGMLEVSQTGMYLQKYDAVATAEIIKASKQYPRGIDISRLKQFAEPPNNP